MKLLTITNRLYLTTLVIVLLVGGMGAFFILRTTINNEFNKKLFAEKEQLVIELGDHDELQENYLLNIGDKIMLKPIPLTDFEPITLKDTILYDPIEATDMPYRVLSFSQKIENTNYLISITKSLLPNIELVTVIVKIVGGISTLLILALIFINRVILRKLWAPFDYTLNHLKTFDITNHERMQLDKYRLTSKVDEFKQLNIVLDQMITQSIKDYTSLKEFTENTSHEIQTPLAIIKNKAESLLQENLTKEQLEDVDKIYDAAGRLSRLKSGLSLMSRIDNNQFITINQIDIKQFILQKLEDMEELIAMKNIKVTTSFFGQPILNLNEELAGILLTNLLSNAIKHNIHNGTIHVILKDVELLIENTGNTPTAPTDQMFDRFQKSGESAESTGLGLSLAKKIVEYYQLNIRYIHENNLHKIYFTFDQY